MKLVFTQIGNIRQQRSGMVVQDAPGDDPAHVRPEAAVAGRMRVTFHVSILVVDAVRRDPEKRSAFQRQCGADRQKIFNPLVRLESAVREQSVITHADAQAAGNPPQQEGYEECLPGKHEERNNGAYVECSHEKCCEFAQRFLKRAITLEKVHRLPGSPWWIRSCSVFDIQATSQEGQRL